MLEDRIDALFAPWNRDDMPGAAVAVLRHGDVLVQKVYGMACIGEKAAIHPKTRCLLASLTKQFTAMAIMLLVERRQLRYECMLSRFFPEFPPYAHAISIRHLLHHTSGLPEYARLFLDQAIIKGDFPRSINTPVSSFEPTSRDAVEILARHKSLQFAPGDAFRYTNSNYVLLAQIVEQVSCRPYATFMQEEIFNKLKMDDSVVPVAEWPNVPQRATSYSWWKGAYGDIDYTPLNQIYGDDGIYSTIEDMVRWDQALNTGDLISPIKLYAAFQPGIINNGCKTRYGFGWFVEPDSVWHNGSWLGFRTYIIRFVSSGLSVIVLSNCAELNADAMARDIAGMA